MAEKTTEPKGSIATDPEIVAMSKIAKILAGLDPEAKARVVEWFHGREKKQEA